MEEVVALKKREAKLNIRIFIIWLISKALSIRHELPQPHKHLLIHFNIISNWMRRRLQGVTASHSRSSPRVFCLIPPPHPFLTRSTTLSGKEVSVFRPLGESPHSQTSAKSQHAVASFTKRQKDTQTRTHMQAQSSWPSQCSP